VLSELPKLFGKTFAVGYLLPAVTISIVILFELETFHIKTGVPDIVGTKDLVGATFLTLAVWLFAVALMALNYSIIRILEGYGKLNPFHLIGCRLRSEFRKLKSAEASAREEIAALAAVQKSDPALSKEFADVLLRLANDFPDDEGWLLPTRFGNTIRAFEVYPRVIYGPDGIPGWDRLVAVIPKDFREEINDAKSLVDFWLNLWFGAIVVILVYPGLAYRDHALSRPWIPVAALVFAVFAAAAARMLARNWGALIKSAFDVYRADLRDKFKLKAPRSVPQERAMWQLLSQVMVFRSKDAADRLTQYRKHEPD
jgi:hypothetical protein